TQARSEERFEQWRDDNPDATARQQSRKQSDVRQREFGLGGDVHHVHYLNSHPGEATRPDNLWVTKDGALPSGTGKDAHTQIHQAMGGETLATHKDMYKDMAWGDHPDPGVREQVRRSLEFQNPNSQAPLEHVREEIQDWDSRDKSEGRPAQRKGEAGHEGAHA